MKYLLVLVLLLTGCGQSAPTYEELKRFTTVCKNKERDLKELNQVQRIKNFPDNPDNLSEEDRKYNALLQDLIWWYSYRCEQ